MNTNIVQIIKKYFDKEYGYVDMISYSDTVPCFDESFEDVKMIFLITVFLWARDMDNTKVYATCSECMLFLLNDVAVLGKMQAEDVYSQLIRQLDCHEQTLQMGKEYYKTIIAFQVARNLKGYYVTNKKETSKEWNLEKEELEKDRIAYEIVMKILMEQAVNGAVLEKHTYLAPLMYLEFLELCYYTEKVLHKPVFCEQRYSTLIKRKNGLFAVANKEEDTFDRMEGERLYSGFLDVCREYRNWLLFKTELGK